ncbi:hypothetical protein AZI98_10510 [Aeribacillus pallidus]|uniref:Uncharacterized protein n=1 Tax=Aeribacillus pallidus TaxID=33936 RepID=A0A165XIQ8_9BACI|nr:hypothetical protein AZI98_10510 [Aeribacillus pallidus]
MNIPEFFTSVHRFSKYALEKVFKKRLSQNYIEIFHLLLTFLQFHFAACFSVHFFHQLLRIFLFTSCAPEVAIFLQSFYLRSSFVDIRGMAMGGNRHITCNLNNKCLDLYETSWKNI